MTKAFLFKQKIIWLTLLYNYHLFSPSSLLFITFLALFLALLSLRGTSGKEPACQFRRLRRCGYNSWSGRSPGGGSGNSLQYSCLEKPTDRGNWRATVHSVTMSRTWLKQLNTLALWGSLDVLSPLCVFIFQLVYQYQSPLWNSNARFNP